MSANEAREPGPGDLAEDGREWWDQQPKESDQAYYCFCLYRDYGPLARSASRVASDASRHVQQITRWRSRWFWVARARAFDHMKDVERQKEQVQEAIDMGRRQATEARAIQQAMMIPVRELLVRMSDIVDVEQIKALKVGDLLALSVMTSRIWPAAMRAEREARGAPTPDYGSFVEVDPVTGDVDPLSTEEHLREVWLAMQEAGLTPGPRGELPPGDVIEANGHVEHGHVDA